MTDDIRGINFIDSFQFMTSSFDELVVHLRDDSDKLRDFTDMQSQLANHKHIRGQNGVPV